MTTLLSSHLAQISLCSTSIAELTFAPPKIFTNALLSPNHDITSLIRDTEQHERALFHLAPPSLPRGPDLGGSVSGAASAGIAAGGADRRKTAYASRHQPKNKAVAAVLGGDLFQATRRTEGATAAGGRKGDIDVELLLHGAEKLAAVYPIPGAGEQIIQLRRRHQQLAANIAHYESRVAEQTRELQAMNRPTSRAGYGDDGAEAKNEHGGEASVPLTREDLEREEEAIAELERKKSGLEERVVGMERDLGGLMR